MEGGLALSPEIVQFLTQKIVQCTELESFPVPQNCVVFPRNVHGKFPQKIKKRKEEKSSLKNRDTFSIQKEALAQFLETSAKSRFFLNFRNVCRKPELVQIYLINTVIAHLCWAQPNLAYFWQRLLIL